MSKKKLDSRDLISKIDKIAKERIAKEKVVSLSEYRNIRRKQSTPNILVVEDDKNMRLALERIFQEEGYEVITASDGTQLSSILEDKFLDLIVLDIGLPWVNGVELAQLMREDQNLKNIPLIFISGRLEESFIKQGEQLGAEYIKKPFDIEHVKKTVRTLLKMSS